MVKCIVLRKPIGGLEPDLNPHRGIQVSCLETMLVTIVDKSVGVHFSFLMVLGFILNVLRARLISLGQSIVLLSIKYLFPIHSSNSLI